MFNATEAQVILQGLLPIVRPQTLASKHLLVLPSVIPRPLRLPSDVAIVVEVLDR